MSGSRNTKSGKYCCIPNCPSYSGTGHHLYTVPSGNAKRFGVSTKVWADEFHQVLFKYRFSGEFKNRVNNRKVYICQKHFEAKDIQICSSRSWLKIGAVPKLNLPLKSHSKIQCSTRRIIDKHDAVKNSHKKSSLTISNIKKQFGTSYQKKWRMFQVNDNTLHFSHYSDAMNHGIASISLLITLENGNVLWSCAFEGVYVDHVSKKLASECAPDMSIHLILKNLLSYKICSGYEVVADETFWNKKNTNMLAHGQFQSRMRFISDKCEVAYHGQTKVCTMCMIMHVSQEDNLKRKQRRIEIKKVMPLSKFAPLTVVSKERLQNAFIENRRRISDLEKEFEESGVDVSDDLACILNTVAIQNDFLKEWWKTQKRLQCLQKNNHRYPPSVIRYCLMLYAKSPAAYNMMQQVMILPSSRTLREQRNIMAGTCDIGLQSGVVTKISDAIMDSKKKCDTMVVLAVDEMTIKENIAFKSSNQKIVGYVDYDDDDFNMMSNSKKEVADHMLAVYVRGITNKRLDGVIAFYPTAGIVTSDLFFILTELIIEIPFRTKCVISGIIFDGLAANRSVMRILSGACDDKIPFRMRNPLDTSRFIFFLPDPPHLVKTTRNNILSCKKSLWNNGDIFMEPIKQLIKEELQNGDLRKYHKLTHAHGNPNPWEKMNVAIAAQTLSHTIGNAMKERGYDALGLFLQTMDVWFDCMNAGFQNKKYKDSRKPFVRGDKRLKWMEEDFPNYLDTWKQRAMARPLVGQVDRSKMVLSVATEEGLRIATKSMVALIKKTLEGGAEYVLPRRLSQDILESYFGVQRQRGYRNEAPTVSLFAANARAIDILKQSKVAGSNVENIL